MSKGRTRRWHSLSGRFDISATLIRERLQQGLSCDELMPAAVLDYIHQHGLYQKSTDA